MDQPLPLPAVLTIPTSWEAQWKGEQTLSLEEAGGLCSVGKPKGRDSQAWHMPVRAPGGRVCAGFKAYFMHSFIQQIMHSPCVLPQALHPSEDIKVKKSGSLTTPWRRHTTAVHRDPSVPGAVEGRRLPPGQAGEGGSGKASWCVGIWTGSWDLPGLDSWVLVGGAGRSDRGEGRGGAGAVQPASQGSGGP